MVLTPEQEAELRAAEDMARRLLNSRSPIPGRPGISPRSTGNFVSPLTGVLLSLYYYVTANALWSLQHKQHRTNVAPVKKGR
jgi:hypothetical protein